jgi:hypothetical protein
MRKVAITTTAFFTLATSAQTLQCPNPDILNGLVFLGRGDMKLNVTRGSPGFMGDFRVPAGFLLIGTGVRATGMTTVAYKTSLSGDKAHAALLAALGADGWEVEPSQGPGNTFNVAREGTVCRNGERRMLLVTQSGGATYVSINSDTQQRRRDCNAPDPALNMQFGRARNAVPRFQFPVGTSIAQGGGGGGGNGRNYTTSSRIISTETSAGLVQHLASQIAGQGWSADSGWDGSGSAGSTWRRISDGEVTTGVLQIVKVSEGTYDVDFTIAASD